VAETPRALRAFGDDESEGSANGGTEGEGGTERLGKSDEKEERLRSA